MFNQVTKACPIKILQLRLQFIPELFTGHGSVFRCLKERSSLIYSLLPLGSGLSLPLLPLEFAAFVLADV